MKQAIMLSVNDNVATVLETVAKGEDTMIMARLGTRRWLEPSCSMASS